MVRSWMHTGFLTTKGEKMSKSLGNFITIRDFLERHSPRLLRFFVLKTHYRSPIDYSETNLVQAEQELERIDEFVQKIKTLKSAPATRKNIKLIQESRKAFFAALEDDMNTPKAVATLFELVKKGNTLFSRLALNNDDAKDILAFLKDIDEIFSFIFWQEKTTAKIPQEVIALLEKRERYRAKKEWKKADETRTLILKKGWQVEDTEKGPKLKKAPFATEEKAG